MMEEEEEETLFDQEGLLGRRDEALSEKKEYKRKILKTAALSMSFFCLVSFLEIILSIAFQIIVVVH